MTVGGWIFMIASLAFTFTNIDLAQEDPLQFVGLRNWQTLLGDGQAWAALGVTLRFALIQLPVVLVLPFLLAVGLNSRHVKGGGAFRVLFFLPYVVPFVSGVLIWGGMLNSESGWVNEALRFLGVQEPPNWINDPGWVYPALVMIGIWMVSTNGRLAGLHLVATELRFAYVTLAATVAYSLVDKRAMALLDAVPWQGPAPRAVVRFCVSVKR